MDSHPLGCHRPRIPDRLVFDKLVQVLVFGYAYHRIADDTCSATTLRRRRDAWIAAGVMDTLLDLALGAYDRMIGLELADIAVDGCITKAPCGGEVAGRSPVDRDDVYFLAGPQDRPRAERYTRPGPDGHLIDYWVGVEAIVAASDLRNLLAAHPDAWVVVDEQRLYASWAPYAGAMTEVIEEMTTTVFATPDGALVLRAAPSSDLRPGYGGAMLWADDGSTDVTNANQIGRSPCSE